MTALASTLRHPVPHRRILTGTALGGLLAAGHAASDIPLSAVTALLPTVQHRFGFSESVLALIVAILAFAGSVTQPLFGALADRVGARTVGAAGVVASSALLSLVGVAPSVWLVFGLILTGGLASAAMHPALATQSRRNGVRMPTLSISLFGAAGTLGVAIGPVAVLGVMSSAGAGGTPWLMVPGVILGLLAYVAVPDDPALEGTQPRSLDLRILASPVGGLAAAATLAAIPSVAFGAGITLWLVHAHDVARDAPVIGWTLSAFSLAATVGGIGAGLVASRIAARVAVSATMIAAIVPLAAVFGTSPGGATYFIAVMAAGALLNAGMPIMIVTAQDAIPRSAAAAYGLLMGFAHGVAGLAYIGVGWLQELIGYQAALSATYVALIPAAAIAFIVLSRMARPASAAEASPTTEAAL